MAEERRAEPRAAGEAGSAADAPVLVVNAGSSSLKVRLTPPDLSLLVERIGGETTLRGDAPGPPPPPLSGFEDALRHCLERFGQQALQGVMAVGHRVVHGGERYTAPVLLDDEVLADLEALSGLAPLHNPANLEAIRAAMELLPQVPHVAVFDTSFHATLPPRAFLYGLPHELYEQQGIRVYGFHGTSHDSVTRRAAAALGRPRRELRIVSLHLGNGASASAVDRGRSIDTSMGFTPMAGLLMGSRAGDVDPGVLLHLLRNGMSVAELDDLLNRRSGLKGLSGVSNDMRDVRRAAHAGSGRARAALDVFGYRIRKTIAAYAAAMGGLDAVAFTGGIGENDAAARAEALAGLEFMGVRLDAARNAANLQRIDADDSAVALLVLPSDEEQVIAAAARRFAPLAATVEDVV